MTLRLWRREKIITVVNISGLAIGLAVGYVMMMYVFHETSYDRFQPDSDRLYRVISQNTETGRYLALTPENLGHKLQSEFPEVEQTAEVYQIGGLAKKDEQYIQESNILVVNKAFFDLFSFPFNVGSPQAISQESFPILITKKMAEKYFPDGDPVGKTLDLDVNIKGKNPGEFKVVGVLENIPHQSHLQMDFVIPLTRELSVQQTPGDLLMAQMISGSNSRHTYIKLREGVTPSTLENKFKNLIEQSRTDVNVYPFTYSLQPITDIHMSKTHVNLQMHPPGSRDKLLFLALLGLSITLIALINYLVLTTANSTRRMKEIGVRKVIGALRGHLIQQMFIESVAMIGCAIPAAIFLMEFLVPRVNQLLDVNLSGYSLQNTWLIAVLVGLTLLVGFFASTYIIVHFVKHPTGNILKGQSQTGTGRKSFVQNTLIAVQMTVFIGLIVFSIVIERQTTFMQDNSTLGFEQENVVSLWLSDKTSQANYTRLKNALTDHSALRNVTGSNVSPPAYNSTLWGYKTATDPQSGEQWTLSKTATDRSEITDFDVVYESVAVDYDYFDAMGIKVLSGEPYSEERPRSNSSRDAWNNVFVNEAFIDQFEIREPVGAVFQGFTIAGVVQNFHTRTLYDEIEPLVIFSNTLYPRQIIVKVREGRMQEAMEFMEKEWKAINPDTPFIYEQLDNTIEHLYRTEANFLKIVRYFAALAILIICSGLFGLSMYITEQRTKEIGIRKVLGASLLQILNLLVRQYLAVVLIAALAVAPIAWYVMNRWLQNYAYHIEIGVEIFVIAGLSATIIAILTVSWQAIKAALANPVESLKNE